MWRYLDEIDRRGGMVAAIADGYPQSEIADAAYRFQREFDAGERTIVGVNGYVQAEPIRVPAARGARGVARTPPRAARRRTGGARCRSRRGGAGRAARCGLPARLERHQPDAPLIRCAEAYATLGEKCGVLREVFGEYREPVAV